MQRFIVAGVPRSGKTTLAQVLAAECGLSVLSGDALVSSFQRVHPELGITHHADSHADACAALWPFLSEYLLQVDHEGIAHVLDTYHLAPEMAATLSRTHGICFLGYPDAEPGQKLESLRRNAAESDWITELSDADLETLVARFIRESAELRESCARLGLHFVDTGREGAISVDRALALLTEGESLEGES